MPSEDPARLRALPDGPIHTHVTDGRTIIVQKAGSELHLLFDSEESCEIQSRLDLARPLDLVSTYTRACLLGLLWVPRPRRVHVLGLGGGRMPMVLRHHLPETVIDCTEIDAAVVEIATTYFGVRPDEHLHILVEDGRGFLECPDDGDPYDLLIVDAFTGAGAGATRLATVEFWETCRRRLAREGVAVLSILPGDPLLERKVATIASVFPCAHLYAEDGTTVVFAHGGPTIARDELARRASHLQATHRFAFPLDALARSVWEVPSRYAAEGGSRVGGVLRDDPGGTMPHPGGANSQFGPG
jgi:spermidine synthase